MNELEKDSPEENVSIWTQRAEESRKHGHSEVAAAATTVAAIYEQLLSNAESEWTEQAPLLIQANLIRKKIEASEQHRSMCVEHGLSDAAIDATYEIEALEKQLVSLVRDSKS
jgi:hypothetical protein